MNRKKFLKQTTSGFIAASFLPLLSFTTKKKLTYETYKSVSKTSFNGKEWSIEIDIDDNLVKDYNKIDEENKEIGIYCTNDANAKLELIYKAISASVKTIDGKILNFITFKIGNGDMEKEEIQFANDNFGKTFIMEVHDKCHAIIRNEKTKLEITFKYKADSDEENPECFLTTACVFHKGFPDDCHELTILRNLRKNVMNPDINYKKLISEYEIIAPKMLANINNSNNKNEILDHIYSHLVLPSVSFVEAGRNEDAISHYTNYVKAMKKLYL